jgi:hypothetical protein
MPIPSGRSDERSGLKEAGVNDLKRPATSSAIGLPVGLLPLDETTVDRDLWALLRWMIEGTGGDWTVDDLEATGRLYKVPVVEP